MKKGPLYLCGAAAAAVCVLYHTLAPKGVPFSPAPVPISESLFPLMTGPRAAASRKNWGPLPASTLQHRPMN